jgi:hypothetical protein
MKIVDERDEAERSAHRFFLYHPDTTWYPALYRMVRGEPLRVEFCVKDLISTQFVSPCKNTDVGRAVDLGGGSGKVKRSDILDNWGNGTI